MAHSTGFVGRAFDSASIFGALVDPAIGGQWSIRPANDSQISRRYIGNTNVLETTFSTGSGKIVLTDFMPVTSEEEKSLRLWPEHELLRLIKCEAGEVSVIVNFDPRPDYGRTIPSIKDAGQLGWQYGPTLVRQLEPPGFLGLHYGIRIPVTVLVAYIIFGMILGAFYVVK